MKKIYKYPLNDDIVILRLRGKPISVISQYDIPRLYAYYDPNEPEHTYQAYIFGTGHPIPDDVIHNYTFLGTVSTHRGTLIWHIFVKEISR